MKLDGDLGAYLEYLCKLFVMTKGLRLDFDIKWNICALYSLFYCHQFVLMCRTIQTSKTLKSCLWWRFWIGSKQHIIDFDIHFYQMEFVFILTVVSIFY